MIGGHKGRSGAGVGGAREAGGCVGPGKAGMRQLCPAVGVRPVVWTCSK